MDIAKHFSLEDDGTLDTVIVYHPSNTTLRYDCDTAAEYRDPDTGELDLDSFINDFILDYEVDLEIPTTGFIGGNEDGYPLCICGNCPDDYGFHAVTPDGEDIGDPLDAGVEPGQCYKCDHCGAIYNDDGECIEEGLEHFRQATSNQA